MRKKRAPNEGKKLDAEQKRDCKLGMEVFWESIHEKREKERERGSSGQRGIGKV